ncbi:hypothetical protein UVI_02062450 [Ustilaginoidea virens]|uniref:Uncharacterized protein n=1 Tax=Ustilaginoidea virens TaxID=1159556 RepID=A0A1B5L7M9_USTVR|nr:hypothetical protein UVI_02062450 [Ustilaginoidea virens]
MSEKRGVLQTQKHVASNTRRIRAMMNQPLSLFGRIPGQLFELDPTTPARPQDGFPVQCIPDKSVLNTQVEKVRLADAQPVDQVLYVSLETITPQVSSPLGDVVPRNLVSGQSRAVAMDQLGNRGVVLGSKAIQFIPRNVGHLLLIEQPDPMLMHVLCDKVLDLRVGQTQKPGGEPGKRVIGPQYVADQPLGT